MSVAKRLFLRATDAVLGTNRAGEAAAKETETQAGQLSRRYQKDMARLNVQINALRAAKDATRRGTPQRTAWINQHYRTYETLKKQVERLQHDIAAQDQIKLQARLAGTQIKSSAGMRHLADNMHELGRCMDKEKSTSEDVDMISESLEKLQAGSTAHPGITLAGGGGGAGMGQDALAYLTDEEDEEEEDEEEQSTHHETHATPKFPELGARLQALAQSVSPAKD